MHLIVIIVLFNFPLLLFDCSFDNEEFNVCLSLDKVFNVTVAVQTFIL